ncbi:YraN family protein [Croceivirga radicis]|uniref:YraN family protein n=1 Tax=Croceivirga radicis TaxID=1929488 RepID=UPI000255B113|nr:YraN family protein [Croceivirga radicis]
MGQHNEFGRQGERLAVDFLNKKGYRILERNYRYLKAEIDILALKEDTLAVVEVKTRSSNYLQDILETVSSKKMKLLVAAADNYITNIDLDLDVRFDVITILKEKQGFKINHVENAFYHF